MPTADELLTKGRRRLRDAGGRETARPVRIERAGPTRPWQENLPEYRQVEEDMAERPSDADRPRKQQETRRGLCSSLQRPKIKRTVTGQQPGAKRTAAGQQPRTNRTVTGQQPGAKRTAAGQQPRTNRTATGQQPGTKRTAAGQQPRTNRTATGQQPGTKRTAAGQQPGTKRTAAGQQPGTKWTAAGQQPGTKQTAYGQLKKDEEEFSFFCGLIPRSSKQLDLLRYLAGRADLQTLRTPFVGKVEMGKAVSISPAYAKNAIRRMIQRGLLESIARHFSPRAGGAVYRLHKWTREAIAHQDLEAGTGTSGTLGDQ